MAKSIYKVIIVNPLEPGKPQAYSSVDPEELKRFIKERRAHGVGTLLVYKDDLLQEVHDRGRRVQPT